MASLQESPTWEEKIYRLQAHIDSPSGGADGITNLQPRQIANRTRWLFSRIAREHTLLGHLVTADQIDEAAAIDGSKTTLDVPFEDLHAKLSECESELARMLEIAEGIIGSDGLKFEAVTRAQRFLWEKGAYSFGWEFFTSGLSMRQFEERPILSTVHHDDTIILTDVSGISVGDLLVVYSEGGTDAEVIEVASIIQDSSTGQYRILAKDERHVENGETVIDRYAINVDRSSGYIGSVSWTLNSDGSATAPAGSIYLSGEITSLENAHEGKLIIKTLDGSGPLIVEVNYGDGWEEIEASQYISTGSGASTEREAIYELPAGTFQLKASAAGSAPAEIGYMAVVPVLGSRTVKPIRKPSVLSPEASATYTVAEMVLESSVFRRAYGDNLTSVEFAFCNDSAFPAASTKTWSMPTESATVSTADQDDNYVVSNQELLDFFDALDADNERVFPYGDYFVRCRHVSDVGDVSEWSDAVMFSLADNSRVFGFDGSSSTLRIGGFDYAGSNTGALPEDGAVEEPGLVSGQFRSLSDPSITRFGFAGTDGTLGWDEGTFIKE